MSEPSVPTERVAPATQLTLARVAVGGAAELAIALVLLAYVGKLSPSALLGGPMPPAGQALGGLAISAALAAVQILLLQRYAAWQAFSRRAIAGTALGVRDIVLVSIIVGIAEELLFRAALQPLLGLWATALVFAVVHWNYASLRGPQATPLLSVLALATVFMLGLILGIVYERLGLLAAMVAHAVYDLLVLLAYRALFRW